MSLAPVILLTLAGLPLAAQTSQQKGRQLVEECLKAVGGKAFLEMRDRIQTGRAYQFSQEQLRALAVVTSYVKYDPQPAAAGPDWLGVRERRDFGKDRSYGALFADGKGYEITFRGARPFPESYMAQYRDRLRRDVFYLLKYRLEEPGMVFESLGTEIVDLQPTDAVRITDADNHSATVYLLRSSRLPIRQEHTRRDTKTREVIREVGHYSKYRTVAGVQLPWSTLVVRDNEKISEMFVETMEINRGLEDSLFTLQKGIKVLPELK